MVGKTEVEVIRDWFINIFIPVEKTADIVVTDFKFEQLNHLRASYQNRGSRSIPNKGSSAPDPGVESDASCNGSDGVHMPFTVLKKADVNMLVGGKPKLYSVVIKVLPTDDVERHTSRRKFSDLLKFSKEVQVYCQAIRCMVIYDEKRYSSACIEPPVPKCYLGQLDAQNDVLVLEDLGQSGYRKFSGASTGNPGLNSRYLSDVDHCRVVLRRLAHFHAFSTLIQRDSGELLLDLFPFAVDAMVFKEQYQARVAVVKAELVRYLVCNKGMVSDADEAAEKVERHLQDLFWRLVELRAQPQNIPRWKAVLAHGAVDLRNIVFQYDETSGRPISAKFLDFSSMTVSSPVIDISYFLHSSVLPEVAAHHHSTLLTVYHRAHLEAIKSFGMHGYEMELEDLLEEYHAKQDYGAMMACLLKPALYVLQCLNGGSDNESLTTSTAEQQEKPSGGRGGSGKGAGDKGNKSASANSATTCSSPSAAKNGHNGLNGSSSNGNLDSAAAMSRTKSDLDLESGNHEADSGLDVIVNRAATLKIDKNKVPVDLRLHGYLSNLAKACPCPCAVGSRELTIAELSADSLEDLHILAKQDLEDHKLKAFDCNGAARSSLKKFIKGLVTPSSNSNQKSSSSEKGQKNSNANTNDKEASPDQKKANSKADKEDKPATTDSTSDKAKSKSKS